MNLHIIINTYGDFRTNLRIIHYITDRRGPLFFNLLSVKAEKFWSNERRDHNKQISAMTKNPDALCNIVAFLIIKFQKKNNEVNQVNPHETL